MMQINLYKRQIWCWESECLLVGAAQWISNWRLTAKRWTVSAELGFSILGP